MPMRMPLASGILQGCVGADRRGDLVPAPPPQRARHLTATPRGQRGVHFRSPFRIGLVLLLAANAELGTSVQAQEAPPMRASVEATERAVAPTRTSNRGRVVLKVDPWARVTWSGTGIGQADVSSEQARAIELKRGTYRFRFETDAFCSETKTVVVGAVPVVLKVDFLNDGRTKSQLRGGPPCN